MQTSPQGRQELALYEGTVLHAYKDAVGVWTIATGHTAAAGAPKPVCGMTVTAAEADGILATDLAHIYEPAVLRRVEVALAQHEFDALVSFTYNLGEANLARSTLLARLNAGDRAGAGQAFLSWNKAGGKVLAGLTRRRQAESAVFLTGVYPGAAPQAAETATAIARQIVLGRGMKGAAVQSLQASLAALGFLVGRIDGDFGPKTLTAVRSFQRSHGLSDDGIAGLKTQAALVVATEALKAAA